jgi:hypothetical protein
MVKQPRHLGAWAPCSIRTKYVMFCTYPKVCMTLHILSRHKWGMYTLRMLFFWNIYLRYVKVYIYTYSGYVYIGYVYRGYMYLGYAYFVYVWVGYMYLEYVYPWVCIIVSKMYVFKAWCPGTKVPHISCYGTPRCPGTMSQIRTFCLQLCIPKGICNAPKPVSCRL